MDSDSEETAEQPDISPNSTPEMGNTSIEPETAGKDSDDGKYQMDGASIKQKTEKITKQRYCKFCGGAIDGATRKCTKCGKQYFHLRVKRRTVLAIAAIAVVLILAALNLYQYIRYQNDVSALNSELSALRDEVSVLDTAASGLRTQVSDLSSDLAESRRKNKSLFSENIELQDKVHFYDSYVVFVFNDNTGLYHKYGCSDFYRFSFWVYNAEAAKAKGYSPCPKCCQ